MRLPNPSPRQAGQAVHETAQWRFPENICADLSRRQFHNRVPRSICLRFVPHERCQYVNSHLEQRGTTHQKIPPRTNLAFVLERYVHLRTTHAAFSVRCSRIPYGTSSGQASSIRSGVRALTIIRAFASILRRSSLVACSLPSRRSSSARSATITHFLSHRNISHWHLATESYQGATKCTIH